MSVTVQDLIAGNPSPLCIAEEGLAADALRLMMEHDYSQLPVVNGDGEVVGIITGRSTEAAAPRSYPWRQVCILKGGSETRWRDHIRDLF